MKTSSVSLALLLSCLGLQLGGCAVKEPAPPPVVQLQPVLPPVIYTDTPRSTAANTEAPIATNFATTHQFKLQATQHWMNIADDTGRALVKMLKKSPLCTPTYDMCSLVYVAPPETVTEFSRVFHNQLITTLVKQGVAVSKSANTELRAEIDIQPILFSPNRPQYRYAGSPVELAPGVWALRDVISTSPPDYAVKPPIPDSLHWHRTELAGGQTPQMELLVTVSVGNKQRYLSRATSAYYIADTDKRLYDQEVCSLYKLCPVAADGGKPKAEPKKPTNGVVEIIGDCPLDRPCITPPTSTNASTKTKAKPKTATKSSAAASAAVSSVSTAPAAEKPPEAPK